MLEGIEILIKRMETNPEEFVDGYWDYFVEDNPFPPDTFTEEEILKEFELDNNINLKESFYVVTEIGKENELPAHFYTYDNFQKLLKELGKPKRDK